MAKLKAVPQKVETKQVKVISGRALNPQKCKRLSRSILKPSQYHRLEIVGKDGTQAVVGGQVFIHKSVGELPEKVMLKVEV